MLEKGLVQIYTGDGKGKTTAALGLALRAAGQGNKVLVYQFLKPPSLETGERFALQTGPAGIQLQGLDVPWDMAKSLNDAKALDSNRAAISEALKSIARAAEKRQYDVIVLDEIVFCLAKGLAKLEDVRAVVDRRDRRVEIVMTGRGASRQLIELADLATEMKKVKHPFDEGISSRRGIDY